MAKIDVKSGDPYRADGGKFGTSPEAKLKDAISKLQGMKLVPPKENEKKVKSFDGEARDKLAELRGVDSAATFGMPSRAQKQQIHDTIFAYYNKPPEEKHKMFEKAREIAGIKNDSPKSVEKYSSGILPVFRGSDNPDNKLTMTSWKKWKEGLYSETDSGLYLTPDKSMASAYGSNLHEFGLKQDARLLDSASKDRQDIIDSNTAQYKDDFEKRVMVTDVLTRDTGMVALLGGYDGYTRGTGDSREIVMVNRGALEELKSKATPTEPSKTPLKDRIAKIKESQKRLMTIEMTQGGLDSEQAKEFEALSQEMADIVFEHHKPVDESKVATGKEANSTLTPHIVAVAVEDRFKNRAAYDAINKAVTGTYNNADTPVDDIMNGKNKDISAQEFYDTFSNTRAELKKEFGDKLTLYRAEGQQKEKYTTNWATTREFASNFGTDISVKKFPTEDVIAVNATPNGKYHEMIMGKAPKVTEGAILSDGHAVVGNPTKQGDKVTIDGKPHIAYNVPLVKFDGYKIDFVTPEDYKYFKESGTYDPAKFVTLNAGPFGKAQDAEEAGYKLENGNPIRDALNKWTANHDSTKLETILKENSPELQKITKSNQAFLKKEQGATIKLYRGVGSEESMTEEEYNALRDRIKARGFTAWTDNIEVARKFAKEDGIVLTSKIAVKDILFSPNQGYGSFGESEYVVAGDY